MKNLNEVKIVGKVVGHDLVLATRADGSPVMNDRGDQAISGRLTLQVDDVGTTVEVNCFAYPFWNSGKPNRGYTILSNVMEGKYDDSVRLLSIVAEFSIEYYISKKTSDVSRTIRIRGRFFDEAKKDAAYDVTWTADTILYRVEEIEANDETGAPGYTRYSAYISNWAQELSEVQFSIHDPEISSKLPADSISPDNPMYIILRGTLRAIPKIVKGTDAFGDEYEKTYYNKNWEITRIGLEPYDLYDEEVLGIAAYEAKKKALEVKKEQLLKEHSAPAMDGGEEEVLPF